MRELDDLKVGDLRFRIEDALERFSMHVRDDKHARVGISVVTATFAIDGETLDQLLIVADNAMYRVKSDTNRTAQRQSRFPGQSERADSAPLNERTDDEPSTSVN